MSARNYFSAREKNISKIIDSLPNINQQKFIFRAGQDVPVFSANSNGLINRNLSNYSFKMPQYSFDDNIERSGTPFSDFFSESESGTPDFLSEESDSSTGSILRKSTADATRILADEWERIERTIYDEEGEKVTRPLMVEECKQWKQLHPQLRVLGKSILLPEKRLSYRHIEYDEVITMQYSDFEDNSQIAERLSQSSTDVTPQNSPRPTEIIEPRLGREKVPGQQKYDERNISDDICSLLQITPLQIRSPTTRRQNSSILKSEIASSRWMRNRPDSSLNCERNSAKSFISLDTINYSNLALSAFDNSQFRARVATARQRDLTKLEPLFTQELQHNELNRLCTSSLHHLNNRKVSLPPLLLEEERKKFSSNSASKQNGYGKSKKTASKGLFQIDRVKHI